MQIYGDSHVHSPFCPHGSSDLMESYITKAMDKGLKSLSFTEHAPLPHTFVDPTPEKDSAMNWTDIDQYLKEGKRLKEKYHGLIDIQVGFEVDYIVGFEKETKSFLDTYGAVIEDSILSVHMLHAPNGEYVCLDFSDKEFKRITELFGSVDAVYQNYFATVKKAINANLGQYKPRRIGHITLIEKFSKLFKPELNYDETMMELFQLIKQKRYSLDINTSGFYKSYCGNSYPNNHFIRIASESGIPLMVGSDSHSSEEIGRGYELLPQEINYHLPNK